MVNDVPHDTLEEFLKAVIDLRFNLYSSNPDLVLIMKWQRLESQNIEIQGTKSLPANMWFEILTDLKNRQQINPNLNIDLLQSMIFSLSSLPFLENWTWLKLEEKVKDYKKMIIKALLNLCE